VSCPEGWDGFKLAVNPGHDGIRAHVNLEAIFFFFFGTETTDLLIDERFWDWLHKKKKKK
jgi:hypothetical protein